MVTNGANGASAKRQETARRLIEALFETNGLVTLAADKIGIHRNTALRYANDFPSVKEAIQQAKERMIDIAESSLFRALQAGEPWAVCFYLKCQGKARGYVERQEVTGAEGKPLKVEIVVQSEVAKKLTEAITKGQGTE